MDRAPSSKRPRYDVVFRVETLRLASGSRRRPGAKHQREAALPMAAGSAAALARRRPPRYSLAGAGAATGAGVGHVKKSRRYLLTAPGSVNTLQFFSNQRATYSIRQFCQVLGVVPSRYYAWRHGAVKKMEPARETAMVAAFDDHKRRYGTRRLRVELREKGHRVSRQPLRTALRRHGRKALQPKASTPRTTDSTHGQRYAPNLPLDQPHPTQANRVWVSDIICLPLASGAWAYRCAFQDACTKQVVDWQVRANVPKALSSSTLQGLLA